MSLNKQKGNMYAHVSHTWNTVKGKCANDCSYCYMKKWGKQSPTYFDYDELKTDLGQGNTIFVGSSNDLFGIHVPSYMIKMTLEHCREYNNNWYLFQSKAPSRMTYFNNFFPEKSILGTTIESNRVEGTLGNRYSAPTSAEDRATGISYLSSFTPFKTFVTVEPIMDFDLEPMVELIKMSMPDVVHIGADSQNSGLPEPPAEKIGALIEALRKEIPVICKSNLKRLYKGGE